jgi:glycosyltransferase involved in cell wall biosynthesis
MSKNSVAFVITTFNRQALLQRALDSVTAQMQSEDYVIILDDCSEDSTQSFAENISRENPQIIYHRLAKNSGVNAARQKAIEVAANTSCYWISYIDDDDYLTANVREHFSRDINTLTDAKWIAYAAIDEANKQLCSFPEQGQYSYIEDYMGKRVVKGDFQHFLALEIAKQCQFTTQFKNAEVWYFWCQVSARCSLYIQSAPGVIKEFLEEGITKSGFNREKQLEVAKLKAEALKEVMSDLQYSKILRNLGKALIKNKQAKLGRSYLLEAIKRNKCLFSAYKYLLISFLKS